MTACEYRAEVESARREAAAAVSANEAAKGEVIASLDLAERAEAARAAAAAEAERAVEAGFEASAEAERAEAARAAAAAELEELRIQLREAQAAGVSTQTAAAAAAAEQLAALRAELSAAQEEKGIEAAIAQEETERQTQLVETERGLLEDARTAHAVQVSEMQARLDAKAEEADEKEIDLAMVRLHGPFRFFADS